LRVPSLRPCKDAKAAAYPTPQKVILSRVGSISIRHIKLADLRENSVFDPDCIKLAELASIAVDAQKTGKMVPIRDVPRPLPDEGRDPDWFANEMVRDLSTLRTSDRALGHLFRRITLPAIDDLRQVRAQRQAHRQLEPHRLNSEVELSPLVMALQRHVEQFIDLTGSDVYTTPMSKMLAEYSQSFQEICSQYALGMHKSSELTEEEVVVGTIVAKAWQPRRRENLISQMRDRTTRLVERVAEEVQPETEEPATSLQRCWSAFMVGTLQGDALGARSFTWIALNEILRALKRVENVRR